MDFIQNSLITQRLKLRRWTAEDLIPFAKLNADPKVMEFMVKPLTRHESDQIAERIDSHFVKNGYGLWAVELLETGAFIGFTGLSIPQFEAHFMPCVEVGWRLAHAYWGKGFATEAASKSLEFGFCNLNLSEIVSITVPANVRSRRVMEKLKMHRSASDDFDHPRVPDGHPAKRQVLYRICCDEWVAK